MFEGKFVWYDLMTTDLPAATAFYTEVLEWTSSDSGLPDRVYTIIHAAGAPMGGMMMYPERARAGGAPPAWRGYIGVADVDATASRITAAGGTVHRGPEDIPGVGRFAAVADPQGAAFIIFRGAGDPPSAPAPGFAPGRVGWHELHAADWNAAFAFYAGLFAWAKADAHDMGPMGIYQLFTAGDEPVGGMMTRMDPAQPANWLYYFNVADIDAAVTRLQRAGGTVTNGPMPVPGGQRVVQARDPQGAMFAMVSPPP